MRQEVAKGVAQQYRPSSIISISDLLRNVNPLDESFYKYIPKMFFDEKTLKKSSRKSLDNVINVPVFINEKGIYNRVFIDTNKIATVFGRDEIYSYIREQISKGNLVRIKKRNIQTSESTAPIAANYGKNVSTTIVRENTEKSTENAKKVEKSSRKSLDVDSEGRGLTKEHPDLVSYLRNFLHRLNIYKYEYMNI